MLMPVLAFASQPSIAMFYGANPPWDELHAFDVVVVEPLHVPNPQLYANDRTAIFAYVAVGEAASERDYLKEIPAAWKLGVNADWGSIVLDQSQPAWPEFFAERVIKPLWDAGYRGFFLDTLDSYQLYTQTPEEKARQEAGLIAVISELKMRYPQARLIFNRGFEILPQVHQHVFAVAAESLFQRWDAAQQKYVEVPSNDREWLLAQFNRIRQKFDLPVLSIDYVSPDNRELARATAAKISHLGLIPWVTNPGLDMLGVGDIEVMPRKVLMIHNSANTEYDLTDTSVLHNATMPLNYLGYSAEYLDARRPLPNEPLTGRYAGIVVWLDRIVGREGGALIAWLIKQKQAGVPILILGDGRFLLESGEAEKFGLRYSKSTNQRLQLHIAHSDALVGFETQPTMDRSTFFPLKAQGGEVLLQLANELNETQDAIVLTAWGGYALNPHALVELPGLDKGNKGDTSKNMRWVVNPIELMRRALKLPDMPVPDVTTESGRRKLMVHMDGDGFPSRGEFPGAPYGAEVLLNKILKKYPVPMTMSIIQGEISPNGLYPAQSAELEDIAREMFALPHVEIASHSYSHPFQWRKAVANPDGSVYRLNLNHYEFDLQQEIVGSISYIETKLAPPGKKVTTFLWTGDCNVGSDALQIAAQQGVVSMNGGDTTINRSNPTLTLVAPLGVPKNRQFQVYAPNQNENVYTNNWLGPFYGYERVIETFEMTEMPYRLKPVDIYFHTYSASKTASLKALDRVFAWALSQSLTPIHVSQYVRQVQDFNHMVIARTRDGWQVRGEGSLRELRAPLALGWPEIEVGVAGYNRDNKQQYLHLGESEASIRFSKVATTSPYLVSANASVAHVALTQIKESQTLNLALIGHVPLEFALSLQPSCSVFASGRVIRADSIRNGVSHFSMRDHAVDELRIHCPR